jgi:SAM-dependent methyltransferase
MIEELSRIAPGLSRDEEGIWRSSTSRTVSYPDEANLFFAVEASSFWFSFRNQCILDLVRQYPPSGWIADIGAGNGFVSQALQRAGFPTVLLEPGPAGIANAARRGLGPLVCSTLEDAAFRPGSLPAAGLFDVLEHIEADEAFLGRLHTLLRPGGRLFLSVPAYRMLWSSDDDHAGHFRRYTRGTLARRVSAAGFRVEFSTYAFAPLPLAIFLVRSVPSRLGLRPAAQPNRLGAELNPGQGLGVRLLSSLLRVEGRALAKGRPIPFGSSCLLVASRV